MKLTLLLVSAVGLGIGSFWAVSQEEVPRQDRVERKDYMRAKLNFCQALMEGLSVKDFDMLKTAATEIQNITDGEMWTVYDTPEYQRFSDELKRSAGEIVRTAEEKNLEGTTIRFFDMTLKCIDCHEYLRHTRL